MQQQQQSPQLSRDATNIGISPQNLADTPGILDFLEDDALFAEESKRGKSKTEFLKRE